MHGTYEMHLENGDVFEAEVGGFALSESGAFN
jgi:uncharacterized protein affecting Mg2+/Co2+ transport